jgi:hypothetical protein
MTLTVAELREHITTDLGDDALTRLLDAAYDAIDERAGAAGSVTETHRSPSGRLLMLNRRASAIVSVTEQATGSSPLVLDATDYRLRPSGLMLERLATGINPASYFYGPVDIVLTVVDDASERDRVAIELVALDLEPDEIGVAAERIGDWSETSASGVETYGATREAILASLHPGSGGWIR